MTNNKEHKSDCCGAEVKTVCADEGTSHWQCEKCGKSCNDTFYAESSEDMGEWEKELKELLYKFWEDARNDSLRGYEDYGNQIVILDRVHSLLLHTKEEAYEAGRKAKGSSWREGYNTGYSEGEYEGVGAFKEKVKEEMKKKNYLSIEDIINL